MSSRRTRQPYFVWRPGSTIPDDVPLHVHQLAHCVSNIPPGRWANWEGLGEPFGIDGFHAGQELLRCNPERRTVMPNDWPLPWHRTRLASGRGRFPGFVTEYEGVQIEAIGIEWWERECRQYGREPAWEIPGEIYHRSRHWSVAQWVADEAGWDLAVVTHANHTEPPGTDRRRVLRNFAPWEGLRANQDTAIERVEVHMAHPHTDMAYINVYPGRSGTPDRFYVRFVDRTAMYGQYGFVIHNTDRTPMPGAVSDTTYVTHGWRYDLPINRRGGSGRHVDPAASEPLCCGVRQPAGSECFVCGERVS